nr:PREDICTED: protein ERGIC-53 isoform X1 [Bemisia tabaci]
MAFTDVRWLCYLVFLVNLIVLSLSSVAFRRFEYKYSFKPPYLAQKDGTVPFWEYGGDAIASAENVRIAPSLRSKKGAIWTKAATDFDWWEVDIVFRITGRGRVGADGLAFWYTTQKGNYDGPVFGSSDNWVGLGVFFDSFDNDNKHNNPYILAVVNDGSKSFDHANDGSTQHIAGCLRDFRNKPFPTRAKIEYYQNTLQLLFHSGNTNNDQDFEICFRKEGIYLPKNGFFGLSAATGGLADDHDVLHFLTTSLYPPGVAPSVPQVAGKAPQQAAQVSPEEQQKLADEYADYQRKLELQKQEYHREHPEAKTKDHEAEFEEWYESDQTRELKQIFSGQSQIIDSVRVLSQKLDEVIGRQERAISLLSGVHSNLVAGGVPPPVHQVPHGAIPAAAIGATGAIQRHEVDAIINTQNTLLASSKELRNYIAELHVKSDSILSNQARQPTAQVQSVGYDMASFVAEVRDGLNSIKQDASINAQKLSTGCPAPSCISFTMFLVVAVVQCLVLILYHVYRDSREAHNKKFF